MFELSQVCTTVFNLNDFLECPCCYLADIILCRQVTPPILFYSVAFFSIHMLLSRAFRRGGRFRLELPLSERKSVSQRV